MPLPGSAVTLIPSALNSPFTCFTRAPGGHTVSSDQLCNKVDSVFANTVMVFIFVIFYIFVMNGLSYVSDRCQVSVLFLEGVFKVTGLGEVVSRWSSSDISQMQRFAVPDSRYSEYLQLMKDQYREGKPLNSGFCSVGTCFPSR